MSERIKVSIGRTYNTGNYESLRLDVGLEIDIPKGTDSNTDLFEDVTKEVQSYLSQLESKELKRR